MELVNGRECGQCRVCCVALTIDTDELQKLPSVQCPHLCEKGCSIYEARPAVCQQYFCAWRHLGFLGDHWRPDKCGVLISFEPDKSNSENRGLNFLIVASPPRAFIREWATRIAHLISSNVPVVLSVAGPPGHYSISKLLNEELREAASGRDYGRIETAISEAVALRSQPRCFQPALTSQRGI